jgi:hypothetical protein
VLSKRPSWYLFATGIVPGWRLIIFPCAFDASSGCLSCGCVKFIRLTLQPPYPSPAQRNQSLHAGSTTRAEPIGRAINKMAAVSNTSFVFCVCSSGQHGWFRRSQVVTAR